VTVTVAGSAAGHGRPSAALDVVIAADRARRTRSAVVCGVAVLMLLALAGASLFVDLSDRIAIGDVIPAVFGARDGLVDTIVFRNRAPRLAVGALAGALFGMSGAMYQRLVDNPLATPDVIGISAGAGAGAVLTIYLGARFDGALQVGGLLGAAAAATLVFVLSWRGGGVSSYRLILVGIGVGALFAAATGYLLARTDELGTETANRWLTGSLNGAGWGDARLLAVTLVATSIGLVALRRSLTGLALGPTVAAGLGVRVQRSRLAILGVGAVAAALATSVTGPIGFIALVSGPLAARACRVPEAPGVAGLFGAVCVLAADLLAQRAPVVAVVPIGAVTAVVGAPVLVVLLVGQRSRP